MTTTQHWTVIGIFEQQNAARQAVDALRNAGFTSDQLGFMVRNGDLQEREGLSTNEAVQESEEGTGVVTGGIIGGVLGAADALLTPVLGPTVANTIPIAGMPVAEQTVERIQHKGPIPHLDESETEQAISEEDTMAQPNTTDETGNEEAIQAAEERKTRADIGGGAIAGGIVGGVLGAASAFLLPVIGPIIAGGILVTVLGGAAIGALTGGLLGAFVHMGIPEEHARQYESEVKAGRTIVTVQTENRQQDALNILSNNGAIYTNAHEKMA